ncbi:MAG: hypothetical protein CV087_11125 [Candidatus Brocadia sp. WS118]|nr:MAG: hypothetical protein CV087_11125 [Candidatus Brocadia sp. WS118]
MDSKGRLRNFKMGHNIRSLPIEKLPSWRGGRNITRKGYVQLFSPDHPFADHHHYVFEHRLVVEKHLGRYLRKDEFVHHINGIKTDNRIENLQVMTATEHRIHHNLRDFSGRVCKECLTAKTYIDPKGRMRWRGSEKDGFLCHSCANKKYY